MNTIFPSTNGIVNNVVRVYRNPITDRLEYFDSPKYDKIFSGKIVLEINNPPAIIQGNTEFNQFNIFLTSPLQLRSIPPNIGLW